MYKIAITLALCLFTSFANATNEESSVQAINNFTPEQYLGEWYEIARIPFYFEDGCVAPTTAKYSLRDDNLEVINSCRKQDGSTSSSDGIAYFVESANVGKLKVTFVPSWLRFTHIGRGDYWILYTDYQYSLVGSPNHKYLWILARSESAEPQKIKALLNIAKQQGFDTNQLAFNYPFESEALAQNQSLINKNESESIH